MTDMGETPAWSHGKVLKEGIKALVDIVRRTMVDENKGISVRCDGDAAVSVGAVVCLN
jgi:hypothetical protein